MTAVHMLEIECLRVYMRSFYVYHDLCFLVPPYHTLRLPVSECRTQASAMASMMRLFLRCHLVVCDVQAEYYQACGDAWEGRPPCGAQQRMSAPRLRLLPLISHTCTNADQVCSALSTVNGVYCAQRLLV